MKVIETVCGLDPGLATGGLLIIDRSGGTERITKTLTLKTRADKTPRDQLIGDREFTDAIRRARRQVYAIVTFLDEHRPDLLAVESFVDLASRSGREDRKRWQTPLVIGMLDAHLRQRGYTEQDGTLRWQNPAVLQQFRVEIAQITAANQTAGRRGRSEHVLMPGDQLLTTSHLITAWCHASWSLTRC